MIEQNMESLEDIKIDLGKLTAKDRKSLMEYYEFLLSKKQKTETPASKKLPEVYYHPIKVDHYIAFENYKSI